MDLDFAKPKLVSARKPTTCEITNRGINSNCAIHALDILSKFAEAIVRGTICLSSEPRLTKTLRECFCGEIRQTKQTTEI